MSLVSLHAVENIRRNFTKKASSFGITFENQRYEESFKDTLHISQENVVFKASAFLNYIEQQAQKQDPAIKEVLQAYTSHIKNRKYTESTITTGTLETAVNLKDSFKAFSEEFLNKASNQQVKDTHANSLELLETSLEKFAYPEALMKLSKVRAVFTNELGTVDIEQIRKPEYNNDIQTSSQASILEKLEIYKASTKTDGKISRPVFSALVKKSINENLNSKASYTSMILEEPNGVIALAENMAAKQLYKSAMQAFTPDSELAKATTGR